MKKLAAVLAFVLPLVALAAPVAIQPLPPMRAWTDAQSTPRDRAQDAMESAAVAVADAILAQQDASTVVAPLSNTYGTLRASYVAASTVQALVLVAGTGPQPIRAPSAVATHVFPNPVTSGSRVSTQFQGMPLNFYSNMPITGGGTTPVPDTVEFSLDGGPWVAAKSDLVTLPVGLAIGQHQLRIETFPAIGGNSIPWPATTITVAAGSITVQ